VLGAITGKFDRFEDAVAQITDVNVINAKLRKLIDDLAHERSYWYDQWFTTSREYGTAQDMLLEQIDNLRRRVGEYDVPFADKLQRQSFQERFLSPKGHPAPHLKHKYPGEHFAAPPEAPKVD